MITIASIEFPDINHELKRGYQICDAMESMAIAAKGAEESQEDAEIVKKFVIGSGCVHAFIKAIYDKYSMMAWDREDYSWEYGCQGKFCGLEVVKNLPFMGDKKEIIISDRVYLTAEFICDVSGLIAIPANEKGE